MTGIQRALPWVMLFIKRQSPLVRAEAMEHISMCRLMKRRRLWASFLLPMTKNQYFQSNLIYIPLSNSVMLVLFIKSLIVIFSALHTEIRTSRVGLYVANSIRLIVDFSTLAISASSCWLSPRVSRRIRRC